MICCGRPTMDARCWWVRKSKSARQPFALANFAQPTNTGFAFKTKALTRTTASNPLASPKSVCQVRFCLGFSGAVEDAVTSRSGRPPRPDNQSSLSARAGDDGCSACLSVGTTGVLLAIHMVQGLAIRSGIFVP